MFSNSSHHRFSRRFKVLKSGLPSHAETALAKLPSAAGCPVQQVDHLATAASKISAGLQHGCPQYIPRPPNMRISTPTPTGSRHCRTAAEVPPQTADAIGLMAASLAPPPPATPPWSAAAPGAAVPWPFAPVGTRLSLRICGEQAEALCRQSAARAPAQPWRPATATPHEGAQKQTCSQGWCRRTGRQEARRLRFTRAGKWGNPLFFLGVR